jgi:hypothetical protein
LSDDADASVRTVGDVGVTAHAEHSRSVFYRSPRVVGAVKVGSFSASKEEAENAEQLTYRDEPAMSACPSVRRPAVAAVASHLFVVVVADPLVRRLLLIRLITGCWLSAERENSGRLLERGADGTDRRLD